LIPRLRRRPRPTASSNVPTDADDLTMEVWGQLKNVYDPEIPVNIVDLGLVYDCQVIDARTAKRKPWSR